MNQQRNQIPRLETQVGKRQFLLRVSEKDQTRSVSTSCPDKHLLLVPHHQSHRAFFPMNFLLPFQESLYLGWTYFLLLETIDT